ncbi:MAG: hypothetical protein FGF51_06335 [Candidatus Brockarchaeota archaeon]|nr:hypothetical protein [Candidatus Brockarchaeota archaeon]
MLDNIMIEIKKSLLIIVKGVFYFYGLLWTLRPRKVYSTSCVLRLFYLGFLRIDEKHINIVKLNENELVTRCENPCPILQLSQFLKMDTKYVCKEVSEPVCKFVLSRINPNLIFERNYEHIRPYAESCEERVYWSKTRS